MGPATAVPPPALTCSVLGESRGRSMVFRGRVVSRAATAGSFRLLVDKAGPNGQSNVAQGGTFTAPAGETVLVGSMVLSLEPGAHVDARLEVTAGGTRFDCQSYSGDRL